MRDRAERALLRGRAKAQVGVRLSVRLRGRLRLMAMVRVRVRVKVWVRAIGLGLGRGQSQGYQPGLLLVYGGHLDRAVQEGRHRTRAEGRADHLVKEGDRPHRTTVRARG